MMTTVLAVCMVLVHIVVCIVLFALVRIRLIDVHGHILPFMVLVPLWGPLTVVLLGLRGEILGDRRRAATLEMLRVNDEVHRSMLVAGREDVGETVPLEEALLVNSPAERRRLMLSLLTDDPEGYLSLLQAASLNEDTEVAHYAATAVANISKDADLRLQSLERAFKADPTDSDSLDAYCDFLRGYLASGLVEGRAAEIQRHQYLGLLKRRYDREGGTDIGYELCRAMIAVGDIDDASDLAESLVEGDSHSEDAWMARLDWAIARRDGEAVAGLLDAIDDSHVYLSATSRERLAFWRKEDEDD